MHKYLICIDLDNKEAIDLFLSFFKDIQSIEQLSIRTIVVQHEDAKEEKAHVYIITEKPITKRVRRHSAYETGDIPKFEVKSDSSTYMISPDSTHPNGYLYKTMGIKEPMVFDDDKSDWLEKILAQMYEKVTGIGENLGSTNKKEKLPSYLIKIARSLNIDELKEVLSIKEGTRNPTLFEFAMCLLGHHHKSKGEEKLRGFLVQINHRLCNPPLSEKAVDTIWSSALEYVKPNQKNSVSDSYYKNTEGELKSRNKITCFKYTSNNTIYESVIIKDTPFFISLNDDEDSGSISLNEFLEYGSRIIRPVDAEGYPYKPLRFSCLEELQNFADMINSRKKNITIDFLFKKVKEQISKFIVHDEHILDYLAALIIFSYFQDKFATVPYTMFVSDGGSGKSTIGDVYETLGYRAVNMTDPTSANIFRIFGTIEAGQCTLVLDEAEKIDQYQDMRSILKNGYQNGKKIQRINMNSNQQEHYHTFGLKIMLSERSPNPSKAKGVLDRMFLISNYKAKPLFDIKEIKNPTNANNFRINQELDFLRKTLMIYRLRHFNDDIIDIETGLEAREKELCKPLLQMFYGSESEQRVEGALEKLIDEKNQRKSNYLERDVLEVVVELLNQNPDGVIPFNQIWTALKNKINGVENQYKESEMETEMYGTIYKMSISKMLRDRFGAKDPPTRRTASVRSLAFDTERIKKYLDSYIKENCSTKISCTSTMQGANSDSTDSTDSIIEELFKKFLE